MEPRAVPPNLRASLPRLARGGGFPPAGDVTRFQPLRGIARFYYARPFGLP